MRDGNEVMLHGADAIAALRHEMEGAEGVAAEFRDQLLDTFEAQKTHVAPHHLTSPMLDLSSHHTLGRNGRRGTGNAGPEGTRAVPSLHRTNGDQFSEKTVPREGHRNPQQQRAVG